MKNKKKLIKRIGAVLCAVVVAVSSLGVSGTYYADDFDEYGFIKQNINLSEYDEDFSNLSSDITKYPYYLILRFNNQYDAYCFNELPLLRVVNQSDDTRNIYQITTPYFDGYFYSSDNGVSWRRDNLTSDHYGIARFTQNKMGGDVGIENFRYIIYSNFDLYLDDEITCIYPIGASYNSSLGYLQNVTRKSTYIRDALYNYDDDSLTYHWTHDLYSSSGVDLSSGEYKIRHYISNATVKGYEKEDIVEMSEKYLMAEYDASQGGFSYLQKDYLEKIEEMGYENPNWIDIYINGYFTLQHHYFQIVDTSTNEVGGYLHIYPKDATDDNFGVELMYEGTDLDGNVDEDAPNGYFDSTTGSGETLEDALENADEPKLDDLSGMEEFIDTIEAYGSQVENVSKGFGALLGEFPPWVSGVLGLSFALLFIVVIVSAMKG